MSVTVRNEKVETIAVEFNSKEAEAAIINAARREISGNSHQYGKLDENFSAQISKDGYGGWKVYFRKAETSTAKAV